MKNFFIALPVISFFILSTPASAGVQHYTFGQIATKLDQCESIKASTLEKFERISGTKVLAAACSLNSARSVDLTVQFYGESAVKAVSTFDEFDQVGGLFTDEVSCKSALAEEVQTFHAATELEPVVAYCFANYMQSTRGHDWSMRIDSFGTPKLRPFNYSRHMYDPVIAQSANPAETIKQVLKDAGAIGPRFQFFNSTGNSEFVATYYAERQLPIFEFKDGNFLTEAHARSYIQQIADLYSKSGGKVGAVFLLHSPYSNNFRILSLGTITEPLQSETLNVNFSSLQDCENARARTEENFRNVLHRNVIGSICSAESILFGGSMRLRLFWIN
jgi:hypothetical protein